MTQVPGLGFVDDAWPVVPCRRVLERKRRGCQIDEPIVTAFRDGQVTLRNNRRVEGFTEADKSIGYQGVEPGDLVVHSMDGFAGAIGVSDSRGRMSPVVHIYRTPHGDERFVAYILRTVAASGLVTSLAKGIRERSTSFDPGTLADLTIPFPPLDVQRRIADFLDDQVRLMDGIVGCRQEQARLLAMRYESFLLDQLGFPSMEQPQETGIQYGNTSLAAGIASVSAPSAWKRVRFKSVVHRSSKVRGSSDIPLLSLASAGFLRPRSDDQQPPAEESLPRYLVVEPDDLVINPMWLAGGGLAVSSSFGAVSPDYRVFQVGPLAEPRFLHHLLRCRPYRDQYLLYTRANTTFDRRVAQVDIDSLPLSLPPLTTQRQIAEECDLEDGRCRSTTARMEAQNSLLQERKRSLITAAVTGEFDVSSASARAADVALSGAGGAL